LNDESFFSAPQLKRGPLDSAFKKKNFGYNLTYSGTKCLSVSTGAQADGTCEFFVNALTKSGIERHIHGYAELTTAGILLCGGARVKNEVGSYLGPGMTVSHTTEEIARFRVSRSSAGLRCELLQSVDGTWIGTEPSTMGGRIRRREMKLPTEVSADVADYSVSMYDARSGVPSNTANQVVLPFSAPTPFGLTVRKL